MATSSPVLEKRLFSIVRNQQGYFTAQQAIEAGYVDAIHPYHVRKKNWIREQRGVYRLVNYPVAPDSQYVLWSLWSRNREGIPQGVYSHETALSMFDLSDANPARLHMTVPPSFRRHSKIPGILFLHKGVLTREDIRERAGYDVTRPGRTVRDLLKEGITSLDIVRQALEQGFKRGLITCKEVEALSKSFPAEKELFKGLGKKVW